MVSNMFTNENTLRTERSVEKNLLYRIFEWLGYPDDQTAVDEAVEQLVIPRGRSKERHRPDAVLMANDIPRLIVEAKRPDEHPLGSHYQAASYAFMINQRYEDNNPVRYCMLSNGRETFILPWDSSRVIMSVSFDEWQPDNPKVIWIRNNLEYERFKREMWHRVSDPTALSPEDVARILLNNDALSWATVSRFFLVAKNAQEGGFGSCLDNPWHRSAYSQLVSLGWIVPEPVDIDHYHQLISRSPLTELTWLRAVGFELTDAGRRVCEFISNDPEFRARYGDLLFV